MLQAPDATKTGRLPPQQKKKASGSRPRKVAPDGVNRDGQPWKRGPYEARQQKSLAKGAAGGPFTFRARAFRVQQPCLSVTLPLLLLGLTQNSGSAEYADQGKHGNGGKDSQRGA